MLIFWTFQYRFFGLFFRSTLKFLDFSMLIFWTFQLVHTLNFWTFQSRSRWNFWTFQYRFFGLFNRSTLKLLDFSFAPRWIFGFFNIDFLDFSMLIFRTPTITCTTPTRSWSTCWRTRRKLPQKNLLGHPCPCPWRKRPPGRRRTTKKTPRKRKQTVPANGDGGSPLPRGQGASAGAGSRGGDGGGEQGGTVPHTGAEEGQAGKPVGPVALKPRLGVHDTPQHPHRTHEQRRS